MQKGVFEELKELREFESASAGDFEWLKQKLDAHLAKAYLEAERARVLLEKHRHVVPPELKKKVKSRRWRKELLKKCGKKAFLKPETLSYPVMDDNCRYHCGLLFAAYLLASLHHHEEIKKKAVELYEKNNCEEELGIHPHAHGFGEPEHD